MRELPYKHFFTVKNGKYIWEDPDMFNVKRKLMEGKRGYAIIEEVEEDVSAAALGYYFGGIIRKACMTSECFGGWSEHEIHLHLLKRVRGTVRNIHLPGGNDTLEVMPGDFDLIRRSKKKMTAYINEVIALLNTEYDIYPLPSEHYKGTNRFILKEKHYE